MATLQSRLADLITAIGADIKVLQNQAPIESVIFDGGDPTTDHTLSDSVIFDAGGVT